MSVSRVIDSVNMVDLLDLKNLAQRFIQVYSAPCIVLLDGDMGSGKTQFVRFIVEALGGGEVCSPSFSIHNVYESPLAFIDHIDLYRLEDSADLESTGFWDLFASPISSNQGEIQRYICIEWANRLESSLLPRHIPRVQVQIEVIKGSKKRKFTFS